MGKLESGIHRSPLTDEIFAVRLALIATDSTGNLVAIFEGVKAIVAQLPKPSAHRQNGRNDAGCESGGRLCRAGTKRVKSEE